MFMHSCWCICFTVLSSFDWNLNWSKFHHLENGFRKFKKIKRKPSILYCFGPEWPFPSAGRSGLGAAVAQAQLASYAQTRTSAASFSYLPCSNRTLVWCSVAAIARSCGIWLGCCIRRPIQLGGPNRASLFIYVSCCRFRPGFAAPSPSWSRRAPR
jgi:hypothetical protein